MLDALVFTHGVSNQSTMNHSPDYDNLIKLGYRHYIDECKKNIAEFQCNDVYDMEKEGELGSHDYCHGGHHQFFTSLCRPCRKAGRRMCG